MLVKIGKGLSIDVDTAKLGFGALTPVGESIVYLGLRNRLMDAHASVTADEYPDETERAAAAEAKSRKVLDALYAGEVRTVGTRESDPVAAEAKRLAVKFIEGEIRKRPAGKNKPSQYKRADINAAAAKIADKFTAQAKINVENAKKAVPEGELDLDSILNVA